MRTATLHAHGTTFGVSALSVALGVPRSSAYRWRRPRAPSPRALSPTAQAQVLAPLRDPRFVDRAPAQVYATLLDVATYLCSVRTMYRLLATFHEVRAQRVHPPYAVPRPAATRPNHVWTRDMTDLQPHQARALQPLRRAGSVQSLRRRVDARAPRIGDARHTAHSHRVRLRGDSAGVTHQAQ